MANDRFALTALLFMQVESLQPESTNNIAHNRRAGSGLDRSRVALFGGFVLVLLVLFSKPLLDLARLSLRSDLHSHVLLIPVVSLYLGWRMAKGEGRRAKGIGGKEEDGGRRTEDGGGMPEGEGQRTEDGGRRTEVSGQRSEVSGQRPEASGQRLKDGPRDHGQRTTDSISEGSGQQSLNARHSSLVTGHCSDGGRWIGVVPLAIGVALLAVFWLLNPGFSELPQNDYLAVSITSLLSFLVAGGFFWFGSALMRLLAFPIAFLVFMIPLPTFAINGLETFFQYASAEAAAWLFALVPTPVLRDGLVFQLPTITIRVAQECSGIRSSYVLFITSLLAGHLFLRSTWRRIFLAFFVVPLGILRNGFRVFTIGMLCVYVGPDMIDSPIHHKGGPLFFVMSLVPFFLLLVWLRGKGQRGKG